MWRSCAHALLWLCRELALVYVRCCANCGKRGARLWWWGSLRLCIAVPSASEVLIRYTQYGWRLAGRALKAARVMEVER